MLSKGILSLLIALALTSGAAAAQSVGALDLTATYTSADGTFGFRYPGGWVTQDTGRSAVLATDATVLEAGASIGRGQMNATLYAVPMASLQNLSAAATLQDVMTLLTGIGQAQSAQACEPYAPPVTLTLDGHDALQSDQQCRATENLFIVVDLGDGIVGIVGASSLLGGMAKFGATLQAVAGTMTLADVMPVVGPQTDVAVDPASLPQTYTSAVTGASFRYPDGWRVEESAGLIGLTDGSQPLFPNPPPGQLAVIISVFRAGEIPQSNSADPANAARWYAATRLTDFHFSAPESFRIGSRAAARMVANERGIDGMLLAVPLPTGGYVFFDVLAAPGSLGDIAPLIYASAYSLTSTPAAPTPLPEVTEPPTATQAPSPTVTQPPTEPPTDVPTATATLPPTIAPTATEAPTQPATEPPPSAPTASPTPAVDLSQTYSAPDGSLSFRYPQGWNVFNQMVGGTDFLIVAPTDSFTFGPPAPGKPFGILLASSVSQITGQPPTADLSQRPIDAMNALIAASGGAPFGAPEGFSVGDHPAARSTAVYPNFENTAFIVMLDDDRYAYMNTFAAPGEMGDVEPVVLAILVSVTLP